MIMKGITILVVAVGSITWGMIGTAKEKKKVQALEELERILALLQGRIAYGAGDIGGIFRELCESTQYFADFFRFLSKEIEKRQGDSLQTIWVLGLQKAGTDYLEKETKDFLMEFGGCLGRYDRKTQLDSIIIYRERLEHMLCKSREQGEEKRKLYRVTSVVAGCFLSILIL